jgi:hypothetical protein
LAQHRFLGAAAAIGLTVALTACGHAQPSVDVVRAADPEVVSTSGPSELTTPTPTPRPTTAATEMSKPSQSAAPATDGQGSKRTLAHEPNSTPDPEMTCGPAHPGCTIVINHPTGEDCGTPSGSADFGGTREQSYGDTRLTLKIWPCHLGLDREDGMAWLEVWIEAPATVAHTLQIDWGDGSSMKRSTVYRTALCAANQEDLISTAYPTHQYSSAGKHLITVTLGESSCLAEDFSAGPPPVTEHTMSIPVYVHDSEPWLINPDR